MKRWVLIHDQKGVLLNPIDFENDEINVFAHEYTMNKVLNFLSSKHGLEWKSESRSLEQNITSNPNMLTILKTMR